MYYTYFFRNGVLTNGNAGSNKAGTVYTTAAALGK